MEGNRERIKRLLNLWVEEEDDEGVMIELRKELERRGYIKREEVILREREIEAGKRDRTRLEDLLKGILSGRLEGSVSSSELFIGVGQGEYQEAEYVDPNNVLPGDLGRIGDWIGNRHRRDAERFSGLGVSPEMFYVDSSVDMYAAAYAALEIKSRDMRHGIGMEERGSRGSGKDKKEDLDLSWLVYSIDSSSEEEEDEERGILESLEVDFCVQELCDGKNGDEGNNGEGGVKKVRMISWCDSSVSYGVDGWTIGKDREELCKGL